MPSLLLTVVVEVWGWASTVPDRVGDMPPTLLALGLALRTAESAFVGLVWRNVLRAAYPKSRVAFKTAWGASQGGAAVNAIVPAQAGTAATIAMLRTAIPESSVAGLASATLVQSLFFTGVAILTVVAVAVSHPGLFAAVSPVREIGVLLVPVAAVVLVVLGYVVSRHLAPRLVVEWRKARQGAAIFRNWHCYAVGVAAPSAASYACRVATTMVFMSAFHVPVNAFTVLLVMSSHALAGLFVVTPSGVGVTQALDVAAVGAAAPTAAVAAFSIVQATVLTIWNVVLGLIVLLWAFGLREFSAMVSRLPRPQPQAVPVPEAAE
jgi:uncharacterized membrane protein YbhN (UPF0104 family)